LHITEEISENRFKIAGGTGGMKVSWQVTGIRQDKWAEANSLEVEQEKPAGDQGRYVHPELYDAPREQMIGPEPRREEPPSMQVQPQEEPQPLQQPPSYPPPSSVDYARLLQEHQRQMEELRRQMEALRRRVEGQEGSPGQEGT
jgi:hypothetical protein